MIAGPDAISMHRGDALAISTTVQAENSAGKWVATNISSATAKLSVKKKESDTEYKFQIAGVITNGPAGQVSFEIQPEHTQGMAPGKYLYDVEVTLSNGKPYTVHYDVFELKPDITRPAP